MKGKFIVIDGLDGSGKKTQLDLLVAFLKAKKIKVATVDFPQYYKTFFGQTVGRYLKGEFGNLNQTNPYLSGLTFAGDRWQARPEMEQALKQGKLLLANRYTSSSMAFMAGKFSRKKDQDKCINWIKKLEQEVYGCPQEDMLLYLSVPPNLGQKLVLKKGTRKYLSNQNKYDIHEENLVYLKRIENIYLRLIKKYNHWFKIDCLNKNNQLKTRQQIHQEIIKLLAQKKMI